MAKKRRIQKKAPVFDLALDELIFDNELAMPIERKVPRTSLHSALSYDEWESRVASFKTESSFFLASVLSEREQKIEHLLVLTGIKHDDPDKWKKLTHLLAAKFIPGFRVHDKSITNPLIWTPWRRAQLVMQVADYKLRKGHKNGSTVTSDKAAIIAMVTKSAKGDKAFGEIFVPEDSTESTKLKLCRTLANEHSKSRRDKEVASILSNLKRQHAKQAHKQMTLAMFNTCDLILRDTRQAWTATLLVHAPTFNVKKQSGVSYVEEVFFGESSPSNNPPFTYSVTQFALTRSNKPTS